MNIEGYCNKCRCKFDAHWNSYPDLTTQEAILSPYCLNCKSLDVVTKTDESDDPPDRYTYPEDNEDTNKEEN